MTRSLTDRMSKLEQTKEHKEPHHESTTDVEENVAQDRAAHQCEMSRHHHGAGHYSRDEYASAY